MSSQSNEKKLTVWEKIIMTFMALVALYIVLSIDPFGDLSRWWVGIS